MSLPPLPPLWSNCHHLSPGLMPSPPLWASILTPHIACENPSQHLPPLLRISCSCCSLKAKANIFSWSMRVICDLCSPITALTLPLPAPTHSLISSHTDFLAFPQTFQACPAPGPLNLLFLLPETLLRGPAGLPQTLLVWVQIAPDHPH